MKRSCLQAYSVSKGGILLKIASAGSGSGMTKARCCAMLGGEQFVVKEDDKLTRQRRLQELNRQANTLKLFGSGRILTRGPEGRTVEAIG
jgi:hypothetical protein